jgi:hypothetical protein
MKFFFTFFLFSAIIANIIISPVYSLNIKQNKESKALVSNLNTGNVIPESNFKKVATSIPNARKDDEKKVLFGSDTPNTNVDRTKLRSKLEAPSFAAKKMETIIDKTSNLNRHGMEKPEIVKYLRRETKIAPSKIPKSFENVEYEKELSIAG